MIPTRRMQLLGMAIALALTAHAQTNPPANQISCKGSQGVILIPISQVPSGGTGLNTLFSVPQDCLQLDPASFTIDRSNPQRPVVRLLQPAQQPSYNIQDSETLAGIPDGTLDTFTILAPALGNSLRVYRNGIRLTIGVDYTVTGGNIIKFNPGIVLLNGVKTGIPQPGDILIADSRCTPSPTCLVH